jgi:4-hydroxy-tetrahydrodipicolinate synthase
MSDWGRIITCIVTPFNTNLSTNDWQLVRLAEAAVLNHSDAVIIGDEAGEGAALTVAERIRLFAAVREALLNKGKVIASTFGVSAADMTSLIKAAQAVGVDGIILTAPAGIRLSDDAIYRLLSTAIRSTTLPVMVRTEIGMRSHTISLDTLAHLAALPNVVAVEDATGDLTYLCELLRRLPPRVKVYAGLDELSLPYLAVGAYGVVSSSAQLAGTAMRQMVKDYLGGRVEEARLTFLELQQLYLLLMEGGLPGMMKSALEYLGFEAGPPRPPLLPPSEAERDALICQLKVCRERGLLFADTRGSIDL